MVVITGVQGYGKTYLTKSLVNSLQMDGKIKICSLNQLHWGPSKEIDIFIINDLFYVLQRYEKFQETLTALNEFMDEAKNIYLIITIPSYTWVNHCYEFGAQFDNVLVDLEKRELNEKLTILESIKAHYDLSSERLEKLDELQSDLLVTSVECIGFPALVSWLCNQQSVEKMVKCLNHPLQTIREEITSLKNAKTAEEKGKFLVLAYMCFKGGKIELNNVDKKLFDFLKKNYACEIKDEDLTKYCAGMVNHHLLTFDNGYYEFNLNIMNKIVFVSLAKDSASFVKEQCKNGYFNYVITKEDHCPRDVGTWYAECFTII